MRTMRELLRQETAESHLALDTAVGSLDLATLAGYTRFLRMHLIGMRALMPVFASFVSDALQLGVPDYPVMIASDLYALGVEVDRLPRLTAPVDLDPAAVAYVVAGSRLGVAALRRGPLWSGDGEGSAARQYMDDVQGLVIWRRTVAWLDARTPTPEQTEPAVVSARAAFAVFRHAFEATAQELC